MPHCSRRSAQGYFAKRPLIAFGLEVADWRSAPGHILTPKGAGQTTTAEATAGKKC